MLTYKYFGAILRADVPDCCVHVAHRCHNRQFLLKFECDRRNYVFKLRDTARRYGATITPVGPFVFTATDGTRWTNPDVPVAPPGLEGQMVGFPTNPGILTSGDIMMFPGSLRQPL